MGETRGPRSFCYDRPTYRLPPPFLTDRDLGDEDDGLERRVVRFLSQMREIVRKQLGIPERFLP